MPESGTAESSRPQGWAARFRFRTYTAYSIGCAIVWAVLLIVVETGGGGHKRSDVLFVFLGWSIGWLSSALARWVYPPPRSRLLSTRSA